MIGSNYYRMPQSGVSNDVINPSQPNPTMPNLGVRTAPQSGYLPNNPSQSTQSGKAPMGDLNNLGSPASTGYFVPWQLNNPPSYPQSLPDNPITQYPTQQRMPDNPDRPVYDYMGTTPDPGPQVPMDAAGAQLQSKQIQQLASAVAQAIQKNPQQGEAIMSQIAQEYGEDVAEQIAQMLFGDQTEAYKKGGKLKTKKAGCGCKVLKRMGGRIVEVDNCSGMPIRRSGGMIPKGQVGLMANHQSGNYTAQDNLIASRVVREQEKVAARRKNPPEPKTAEMLPVLGPIDEKTSAYTFVRTNNPYQFNAFEQGMINGWKTGIFPASSSDPATSYVGTNGETFVATKDPKTGLISAVVPQGGEHPTSEVSVQESSALPLENNPELAAVKANMTARQQAAAEEAKKKEEQKSAFRGAFDAAGLSEYQSFAARKKFIADNKAWLYRKGFNVNNYTGTPEQNKALIKLLKEYKANPDATKRDAVTANNAYRDNARTVVYDRPEERQIVTGNGYQPIISVINNEDITSKLND